MIFVHSSFRTGSTYLWSCLRQSARTVTYYEIFHEALHAMTRAQLVGFAPQQWQSRHPPGAPYFLEFLPLLREGGGVMGFDPQMSYGRFIPPDGCGGAISDAESGYVARLIGHAEERGKIPVLTATRSLGRVRGLRTAFPGLHVMLYRPLFQQWCSITELAFRGNPYFLQTFVNIIAQSGHDPMIGDIGQLFPIAAASIEDTNVFCILVLLHLHLYVQAASAADLIVDLAQLHDDARHRADVTARFAEQDVAVDFSGVKKSMAFSLCQLGANADVRERLKTIGDVVIDRAPDAVGRAFGAEIMCDLLEDLERDAFYSGALRSVMVGPSGLLAERDVLTRERDVASAECQSIHLARSAAEAEREDVRAQRDAALAQCHAAHSARDAAAAEREDFRAQRDAGLAESLANRLAWEAAEAAAGLVRAECEAARAACHAATQARDGAATQCHELRLELAAARAGDLATSQALAAAEAQGNLLRAERDAARGERDATGLARDAAAAERDRLRGERDAARQQVERLADPAAAWPASLMRKLNDWLGGSGHETSLPNRWRQKGDAARDARRWRAASRAYERHLATAADDDAIWIQYGHVLKEAGDLHHALAAYERSRQLSPLDAERDLYILDLEQRIGRNTPVLQPTAEYTVPSAVRSAGT